MPVDGLIRLADLWGRYRSRIDRGVVKWTERHHLAYVLPSARIRVKGRETKLVPAQCKFA